MVLEIETRVTFWEENALDPGGQNNPISFACFHYNAWYVIDIKDLKINYYLPPNWIKLEIKAQNLLELMILLIPCCY